MYGVIISQGMSHIRKLPRILDMNENKLTLRSKAIFLRLYEQFILGRVPKVLTKAKYLPMLMHLKTLQPFYHIV